MKHLSPTGLINVFSVVAVLVSNCELPLDPSVDPTNAEVVLLTEKGVVGNGVVNLNFGDSLKILLQMIYPKHFKTIRITTSCGVYENFITPDTTKSIDTAYFTPEFNTTGECTVFVNASLTRNDFKDKSDTLALYIFTKQPGIDFITVPQSLTTQAGKTDTLLFVTKTKGGAEIPEYGISATPPLDATRIYVLYSTIKDTARVIFNPAASDTYTVFITATSPVTGAAAVTATASVEIIVSDDMAPSIVDAPQTIVAGTVDTLIFVVDNTGRSDRLTMRLVTETPLDPTIFTVLPTGTDSILIRTAPTEHNAAGTVRIGIATTNGLLSDTSWYPLTFIDKESALWNTTEIAIVAVEGKPIQHDLRPYFIKPQTGLVFFTADMGTVSDTAWQWTPAYGSDASVTATVTAIKDDTSSLGLKLAIDVTPGDTTKPTLELVDKALNGKIVGSSQITVECIASDSEAGVGKVTISHGGTTGDAALQHEDRYSVVVAGLVSGRPTQITITATDKSMRKNSRAVTFIVTYDSTMLDAEPPVVVYVAGPKNGERVKNADGTITYSISDNSGVDSVWWTLDGTPAGGFVKQADGTYQFSYALATYGNHTIVIHAQDGSPNKNDGTAELKINYNTFLSAVTTETPKNNAADISVEPTFSWTGGTDADGDTVYYVVSYGTALNSLNAKSAETKESSVKVSATNKLTANTTYYWNVTAYTKKTYADTVESTVASFKTSGSAPVITTPLQPTAQVIEGATLTLKIEASGTPAPKYQWYKDDAPLSGQIAAEFSKTNVTASDAGEYFVVVSNGIGSGVTSTKAVVTVRIKATITNDPVAATANEGESVTFTVNAAGDAPLSYQWLKDGQVINGATDTIYNYNNVVTTDSGKNFACIVSNVFSKDTSAAVVLKVIAAPVYTVAYDRNGGSGSVPVDGKTYKSGEQLTVLANTGLTRSGYEFAGWCLNNQGTGMVYNEGNKITIESDDIVLYAKWKVTCLVTFDGQGATTAPSPALKSVAEGTAIGTLPTDPQKTGCFFSGWWTGRKGTGDTITTASVITGPVTLYAKWIIKDYDGNTYTDVTIGTQTWMAENLKVIHYNDGTAIDGCLFPDSLASNKEKYGILYHGSAIDATHQNIIAPPGWHVPDDNDWLILKNYLIANGYNYDGTTSGNKIGKAMASTTGWDNNSTPGNVGNSTATNNKSGFNAEPAGAFISTPTGSSYGGFGQSTFWWSTSIPEGTESYVKYYCFIGYDLASFEMGGSFPYQWSSIRLIRDY
ncbi:MAG: InlB B-repeat-containing protein [Chitinispirillaceae bacterium]|nr:InlB B-repeat-containing protein [Chitinispirillaceae bacterium]